MKLTATAPWALFLAALLPLQAHALFGDDEARKAIIELRQKVDANKQAADNAAAEAREGDASTRRSLLELSNQIEQLRSELARLRGQNEQLAREVSELQRQQKDVQAGIDERLRQVEPLRIEYDGQTFTAAPAEKNDFEGAMAQLRKSEFQPASASYAAFLQRYPASGYTPSVLYWLGNAQYASRAYKEAVATHGRLVREFPAHMRTPEAMLALANSHVELKDARTAKSTLENLVKAHPNSEAAAAARTPGPPALTGGACLGTRTSGAGAPPTMSAMEIADLAQLNTLVLWAAFMVALVFGFIAQRTHFCTMGAISDIVNMGDWTRMRMWGMAVGIAMIGFYGMAWLGWIDPAQSIYTGPRVIWLSAVVGGALFGFGMVLASGCGSKTLVRIGAGSLKSLVVFFVMGIAAFATLRGITAVLRVNTVDTVSFNMASGSAVPAWLATTLGSAPALTGVLLALAVGGGLVVWALMGRDFITGNNLLAGIGLGLVVTAMWWVSGRLGFVAEHPETLDAVFLGSNTGRMDALTFTAPMAYTLDWLIFFSDTSKVLTFGTVTVVGMVVGAFACAVLEGSFRWEGFRSTQDTALHMAGAVCMGVGGVTALGCTVGQGMSGLSTLSVTSLIAVAGIVLGAVGGFRFQIWLLDRE